MWLILCESNDVSAVWLYHGLKKRGLVPVELIKSEMLEQGIRWQHQIGNKKTTIDFTLRDGRSFSNDTIQGVINRLLWAPSQHIIHFQPDDREYVTHELLAFFMSWIYSIPKPVLNRPTPQGLSGQWRHISEWVWLASKAGLPVPFYRQSILDSISELGVERTFIPTFIPIDGLVKTVIVINGQVFGVKTPNHISEGCKSLAKLTKTELLGIEFANGTAGPWTFLRATTIPDLRLGGEKLLNVLFSVLNVYTGEN